MATKPLDQKLPRRPYDDYADGEPLHPAPEHATPLERTPRAAGAPRARRLTPTALVPPLLALPPDHRCGITRADLVVFAVISACVNAIVSVLALEVLHALYRR